MNKRQSWPSYIFNKEISFVEKALTIFKYQYENNPVYQRFCKALDITPDQVSKCDDIPLYPVRGFKEAVIATHDKEEADLTFRSSGTGRMKRSVHYVRESSLYEQSLLQGMRYFYPLDEMVIWGYTPGYNENQDSSLIWMIQKLIEQDKSGYSRFLSVDKPIELKQIEAVRDQGKKILLFGAAFGLLDYLENHGSVALPRGSIVMETGGMKTHKREITRQQMHRRLAKGFQVDRLQVHSEYGMTEMLSQAYARGGAWFTPVPWLDIRAKDPENPLQTLKHHNEGRLGVIDLANVHSCSFLLTGDEGITRKDGKFQIYGRWNPENLRGCNFLVDYE